MGAGARQGQHYAEPGGNEGFILFVKGGPFARSDGASLGECHRPARTWPGRRTRPPRPGLRISPFQALLPPPQNSRSVRRHTWKGAGGKSDSLPGLAEDPPTAVSAFCGSGEKPRSTRAPGPLRVAHAHLPLPGELQVRSGSSAPPGLLTPRCVPAAEPWALGAHTCGAQDPLPPAGPPEPHVPQAPETFLLQLPAGKAVVGNRIPSPGNVTSPGHRSPGRETLLGPGLTTDTAEGSSAPWHRVTSLRLVSET